MWRRPSPAGAQPTRTDRLALALRSQSSNITVAPTHAPHAHRTFAMPTLPPDSRPPPDAAPPRTDGLRRKAAAMVAVYLLAAGLRVGYVAATRPDPLTRDFVKGTDMEVFDGIAREVVAGKWLAGTAGDSPLYPCAFLPLLYAVTGGDIDWAAAVQGTFAAVLVVLVFALARRLYGEFAGAAAGVSVALYASLIIYDTAALGEGLLNVLSAASLLALMAAGDRPTSRRCAWACTVTFVRR